MSRARSSSAAWLLARARSPVAGEIADVAWLRELEPLERERALADLQVVDLEVGELLCRVGRPVTYWFGVIDGLLKTSNDWASMGVPVTFIGLPPGGWFGEGTCLKREAYRYNVQALRRSTVAGLTVDTFHWLLDRSLPFNRFILRQLNERLAQFMAAREIDRMGDPDARVARSLAALFNPVLYPNTAAALRITQEELGYLVGLSRQRVNEALRRLAAGRAIRVEYGGLRVLDLEALRGWGSV